MALADSINAHNSQVGENIRVDTSTPYPVLIWNGIVRINGCRTEGIHGAEFVNRCASRRRDLLASSFDLLDLSEKGIRHLERLSRFALSSCIGWGSVKVVADPVERCVWLMIGRVQKVLDASHIAGGHSKSHELGARRDFMNCGGNSIIDLVVQTDVNLMLSFRFVENLPVLDIEVMTRLVVDAALISEATTDVPR